MVNIGNAWDEILKDEWTKEYYVNLRAFLKDEYSHHVVYPDMHDIFNALKHTDYNDVKVVILGQDPYYNEGQAHGLCFSVKKGVQLPPSLINIYKELNSDLNIAPSKDGDLTRWADNGVLLLNTVLTVRSGQPNSHKGKGWEILTDTIISKLNDRETPVVFILWGGNARSKKSLITNKRHLIIESAHPSPLSAYNGFFGSKPFSRANAFLSKFTTPIDWTL